MTHSFAHPLKRYLAFILDGLIGFLIFSLAILAICASRTPNELLTNILNSLIWLIFYWPIVFVLFNVFLTHRFGGTLGQLLTGIRIVDKNEKYLFFKMALFRTYIGATVSGAFLGLGYLWVFWDKERQGWHDKVSNSFVITKSKMGWVVGVLTLGTLIVFIIFLALAFIGNLQTIGTWV